MSKPLPDRIFMRPDFFVSAERQTPDDVEYVRAGNLTTNVTRDALEERLALCLLQLGHGQDPRLTGLTSITLGEVPKVNRGFTGKAWPLTRSEVIAILGNSPNQEGHHED